MADVVVHVALGVVIVVVGGATTEFGGIVLVCIAHEYISNGILIPALRISSLRIAFSASRNLTRDAY